ncbi:MAG: YggS family pyridoxal phosphate-dependent enzyme [Flammeovirgaceae bacterium TMED290]|nr:MAG: YggS family pyridoxal phosphate-dependent enzyme [Flammeovirgaceae bacterium TMED290]
MENFLKNNNYTCVAVSKTKTIHEINNVYKLGHRDFGENKVQELLKKQKELPKHINWHMIGHLQTNKVKKILPITYLIHSVDSVKLLKVIQKESKKLNIISRILIQVNISEEISKYGFRYDEADSLITKNLKKKYKNIKLVGLMGMASFTDDKNIINNQFIKLNNLYTQKKEEIKSINTLSMGMSNDYKLALKHGSNMIRIGSKIFGERNYH